MVQTLPEPTMSLRQLETVQRRFSLTESDSVRRTQLKVHNLYTEEITALMRLQLYVIGKTHEIVGRCAEAARTILIRAANPDSGVLDGTGIYRARIDLDAAWTETYVELETLRNAALREAGSIAFGTLVRMHDLFVAPIVAQQPEPVVQEAKKPKRDNVPDYDYVFAPQLQAILDAANRRIYADGLNLSQRIWRFDQQSRAGLTQVLFNGIAQGKSAWDIAREIEGYLGTGRDCPRWTRTRLYELTKKDIASGDPRGLVSWAECNGQGVSYNALRMARTEIQAVHAMASQDLMARMPWVEKEQMMLSPAHPEPDICDDIIAQGEGGKGIFPKGTVKLPSHPNCLCYLVSVTAGIDQFTAQLRGWMRGEESWPAMDEYARTYEPVLAMPQRASIGQLIVQGISAAISGAGAGAFIQSALWAWLDGDEETLDERMERARTESEASAEDEWQ